MAPDRLCDRVDEYLDDMLSAEERAAVESHLDDCGECHAAVADYRRLRRLALALPPVEIPDDLGFQIRRRLATTTPPRRRPARILVPTAFAALATAAALLVAVLIPTEPEVLSPDGPTVGGEPVSVVAQEDLGMSISDWLVQAGNAEDADRERLLAEARELQLLSRVRAAIPATRGTERNAYLTAVSDLLVQLENDPGAGQLREEARLVAMVRPR